MKALEEHPLLNLPLSVFLQNSNAGILITDANDHLVWANDIFFDTSGIGEERLLILGKRVKDLLSYLKIFVSKPEIFLARLRELTSQKKVFLGQTFLVKDGRIVSLDYVPLYNNSEYNGALWLITDVTRHYHSIASNLHASDLIKNQMNDLKIAFTEIDIYGKLTKVTSALCEMSGYTEEELIGKDITEVFVPKENQIEAFQLRRKRILQRSSPILYEMEVIMKDGSRKWALTSSVNQLDREGTIIGGMGIHIDITDQKIMQEELERAKRLAENAQQAQQQFLANMSHEIRTPLNAIVGMTYLLDGTAVSREQQEYVRVLKTASGILLGLITDILDFSKIESGKQEVQSREFSLQELIRALQETFQYKLKEKSVRIKSRIDEGIEHLLLGDDVLLNQILMNLLGNAEKFTEKGEILLEATVQRSNQQMIWIRFDVSDTGIGIAPDKLEVIFQDFRQAEDDIRFRYGGSGLGLSICKRLVEMQGGSIRVKSVLGKGTTFSFELPFGDTGKPILVTESLVLSSYAHYESAHVLIVEDNPMNVKYLSSVLEKYGITYDIATHGAEALELTLRKAFCLILMDMRLPGENGLEVCRHIREDDQNQNAGTPVILITAMALSGTKNLAMEAGVNEILTKPYTPDQLLRLLNKYLTEEEEIEASPLEEPDNGEDDHIFHFNPRLDVAYLRKLYSDNCEYAVGLFEVFLGSIHDDIQQIHAAQDQQEWQQLSALLHKVKPNFSMVGLTWLSRMLQDAYDKLQQGNHESVSRMLESAYRELDLFLPVVEEELIRMQHYLKTLVEE